MLVLTRKVGESIEIGGGIRVTVLSAGGNRLRLGIEAPADMMVRRSELSWAGEPAAATPTPPKKRNTRATRRPDRRPPQQAPAAPLPHFTVECTPSLP